MNESKARWLSAHNAQRATDNNHAVECDPMKLRADRRMIAAVVLLTAFLATSVGHAEGGRVGLVLGGGGARGAAHIGVLKVLERERIPVHVITGTSVGAIIGGLYSAGYSPEEIETIITSIDWIDIFRDETARPELPMRQKETDLGILADLEIGLVAGRLTIPMTLVRGQKLDLFLRKMFMGRSGVRSFDDLPIPFRCVATDIGVVKPVVFQSGDLELAIRSSMAVPGASLRSTTTARSWWTAASSTTFPSTSPVRWAPIA